MSLPLDGSEGQTSTCHSASVQKEINPVDNAEMIWIPAGEFLMGSDDRDDEKPPHEVFLDGYWIYMHPVTVSQYRRFCQAAGKELGVLGPAWDDHLVERVSWNDAKAYCDWAGVQLPTEAQWEKAARGTDGRKFPWGNEWDGSKCANSVGVGDNILYITMPVGSYPAGMSPFRVHDMVGNVNEWCADWYDENYYRISPPSNPTGPDSGNERVQRSGHLGRRDVNDFRAARRFGSNPAYGFPMYGFRCVRTPETLKLGTEIEPTPPLSDSASSSKTPDSSTLPASTEVAKVAPIQGTPPPPPPPQFLKYVQPPPRRRSGLLGVLGMQTSPPPEPQPLETKVPVTPTSSGGWLCTNPVDNADMLWIPAGEFLMGSNYSEDEKPTHKVHLGGYWMYKHPVTVAQYRQFCQAVGQTMPDAPDWGWTHDHPMVNVDWYDATRYAIWAGMRLPTEAEWEKAARGTDGREFPWGDEWDPYKCATSVGGFNLTSTKPVGSYPQGASPYGVLDMAGNVWEWCADWYSETYYTSSPSKNPPGPSTGDGRVARGDSFAYPSLSFLLRCAHRGNGLDPAIRDFVLGFRCVQSPL